MIRQDKLSLDFFYEEKLKLKESDWKIAKRILAVVAAYLATLILFLSTATFQQKALPPTTKNLLIIIGSTMWATIVLSSLLTCCYAYCFSFSNFKRFIQISV